MISFPLHFFVCQNWNFFSFMNLLHHFDFSRLTKDRLNCSPQYSSMLICLASKFFLFICIQEPSNFFTVHWWRYSQECCSIVAMSSMRNDNFWMYVACIYSNDDKLNVCLTSFRLSYFQQVVCIVCLVYSVWLSGTRSEICSFQHVWKQIVPG